MRTILIIFLIVGAIIYIYIIVYKYIILPYKPFPYGSRTGIPGIDQDLRHAERISEYFLNAVRVYIFTGDKAAMTAALAAAKVAAYKQRMSMVKCLDAIGQVLGSDGINGIIAERLNSLKVEIVAKDWGIADAIEENQKLEQLDPEYQHALAKADPKVFTRRYPELFRG